MHAAMKYCYTCVWWSSSALIEASQQAVAKVQIAYCVHINSITFFTYKYVFYPASPLGAWHVFKCIQIIFGLDDSCLFKMTPIFSADRLHVLQRPREEETTALHSSDHKVEQEQAAIEWLQLQSVVTVEAKIQEAAKLWGPLNDLALAVECKICFEKLGAGSGLFGGHTYGNRATCGSCFVDTCPDCRLPVASRVQLFGALPDVGGLLEQEPGAPDVGQ